MPSIFTKIIHGEIPCYKIYEDEHTFAFLARDQIALGHTLIVAKIEVDYFVDVPEPYYSAVFKNAQTIARAIQAATGCARVGTMIAGFEVPHFHYHLVPIESIFDLSFSHARERGPEEMKAIQEKIVAELARMK